VVTGTPLSGPCCAIAGAAEVDNSSAMNAVVARQCPLRCRMDYTSLSCSLG